MTKRMNFSGKALQEELQREARALKIPSGTADVIASKITEQVEKWVKKRAAVTIDDLHRRVALEAEKYNADLAYVYQNRGKII